MQKVGAIPIREMPAWLFWTRENGLTVEEAEQQRQQLCEMPVRGTDYLLDEGEVFLASVPYRHRN